MYNCHKATLDSFLDKITDPVQTVVDAIFWLGDNPGHDVYDQHEDDHLVNLAYITQKLAVSFPHIGQVYPLLGNHEGFPCDQFDLTHGTHQWVLNYAGNLWKQWLTKESYESFVSNGRYSQLHPGTKLRIVAINTFLYDVLNSYLWKNSTDPQQNIEWIEKTLSNAEANNESVIIIGHIPPTLSDSEMSNRLT
jgi:Calcineurin-like phosphoesterase